ncbi:HEPN domain-containing protein [Fervidibacter sacchari]|uniref:HEPN domain-containing protein/predicted nucleotidyltransferase n=1 Tax=Candidatus Fervidibacter sacchari TaxID=1448929 RepID=A0ABT2EPV9_9BACT|nr:HEPN domain-containing protein [Candidatus Fervidibacter sacchari]MCS3919999.1 HEPN domain-containing protein/predicted nucleotidyltransferase [Candidatus Fervidibacter sacchari]WKU16767.1 HEPN domain-containing protein [Candidatus Fervidibacter sacchari]
MAKVIQVDLEAISRIAERIVERFRPQRVILFGSQAKGQAHEGSDIDLCVVMETFDKPPHQVAREIEREVESIAPTILWQGKTLRVPVQVHVFSPEDFEGALLRAGVFVTTIAREGIVLYEAEGVVPVGELLARQKPWEVKTMKPETQELVNLAEGDWAAAQWQRQAPSLVPHVVCFLAQQSAEKYMKAFLEEHSISYPRTHDLVELLDLSGNLLSELDPLRSNLATLSQFAVVTHYRGFWATQQDADDALHTAEQVRAIIRAKLGLP